MTGHPNREDLIAYSLGGLDSAEHEAVASHVEGCDACAVDLAHYAPAVSVLGESVEQVTPPPELRERVLAIVNEEAGPEFRRESKRPRFNLGALLLRSATGLAVVALVFAGLAGYLAGENGSGGESRTVPITDTAGKAEGELVISDGDATLLMTGMPQLSQGAVYQVWIADPSGTVTPSATFLPHEDGSATAAIPEATDDVKQVMVTAEPGPNRTDPTQPPILDVHLD
ncbi:anti-sigma factor [soil metagenome]